MPIFESSPEHVASTNSEGEALLLNQEGAEAELATSPPYVKAPLEDRSKYEKLTQNREDISSEDSPHEEADTRPEKKRRRKIRTLPEKLIKNLRTDKRAPKPPNKEIALEDGESDDSIGSASDLRDHDESEDVPPEKADAISESVKTCGSSAYHAECESLATHEEDCTSRIIRAQLKNEAKPAETAGEDMLFVGHQYGEKPLLLDDELDSDCELRYDSSSKWSVEKRATKREDLWIKPSSSFDDDPADVFALAPFTKSKNKRPETTTLGTPGNSTPNSPVPAASTPYAKFRLNYPNNERRIKYAISADPINANMNTKTRTNAHYVANHLSPKQSLINVPNTTNHLSPNQTLTSPLSAENSLTPNPNVASPLSPNSSMLSNSSSRNSNPFLSANATNSEVKSTSAYGTVTVNSNVVNIQIGDYDYEYSKPYFAELDDQSPKSLCHVSNPNYASGFFYDSFSPIEDGPHPDPDPDPNFQLLERSAIEAPKKDEGFYPSLGEYKPKKDKAKKDGKSKYYLIDERGSDESPKPTTIKKTKGSNAYRKVSSKTKKIGTKIKKEVGFSNMSFEDFPSDDERQHASTTTPFEVLREAGEEKKYGSLKRIGNPFS